MADDLRLVLDKSYRRGRRWTGFLTPEQHAERDRQRARHHEIALRVLYEQVDRWYATMLSCGQRTPQAVLDALAQAEKALGIR